jgi:WS/DGAT/MGAT family acyltransferase
MARYAYERLSAQDLTFLLAEDERSPMHVGAVAVLEAGPLRNADGGVDVARYRRAVESVLHWIPRYRQKLDWVPLDRWPVWIDDRHFDLGYHIRHLSLPRPGTLEQLKELASRILSRRLDRSRPLWEIWVIEGVEGGLHFALLNKIHHCMTDGAGGADLSQILFSSAANPEIAEPVPYMPRPAPSRFELLGDALRERAALPLRALRGALERLERTEVDWRVGLRRSASALGSLARSSLRVASQTPINGELGPHRRFDWLTMPLDDVRELRRVLDCSVNDVILATVAGAMRRYLFRRRVDPGRLDFRVAAPVNVRRGEHDGQLGNHVSSWIVRLPLGETDPLARVAQIRELTEGLKSSEAARGIQLLMDAAEWLPAGMLSLGVALTRGPVNMIVTNVPGPQLRLYSVGAPLLGMYPMVPLLPGCGLGIALFSYEGRLCWGFNADWELVPDLRTFVTDLAASFEELRAATVARFLASRTAAAETAPAREPPVAKRKLRAYRGARRDSKREPIAASVHPRNAVASGPAVGTTGAVKTTSSGG